MTKDDIHLLYEYDRWANKRVVHAASTLSPEEFTRDLGGAFRSVRNTLVHIVASEWGWLTYWREAAPTAASLNDLWDHCDILFDPQLFPDPAAVELKWTEVEKDQIDFLNGLTQEALQTMFPVLAAQISLAHLMQHLANHSTYHRGQVAVMMRQLGAEPPATDFALFVMKTRA